MAPVKQKILNEGITPMLPISRRKSNFIPRIPLTKHPDHQSEIANESEEDISEAGVTPLPVNPRKTGPGAFTTSNILALQQAIGNRAVTRLLAERSVIASNGTVGAGSNTIQRKPSNLKTNGGEFFAKQYHAFETQAPTDHVGAGIALEFRPKRFVVGRVGLIQTIRQQEAQSMWVDVPDKMMAKPVGDKGKFKERVIGQSPVYGGLRDPDEVKTNRPLTLADTKNPKNVTGKWNTPAHEMDNENAEEKREREALHYTSGSGEKRPPINGINQTGQRWHRKESEKDQGKKVIRAGLTDTPGFAANTPAAQKKWRWYAEVAAIVLDGEMQGTYLGTIGWGWNYEPSAKHDPIPATLKAEEIELLSTGVPPVEFKKAIFSWNNKGPQKDEFGEYDLIPVPETLAIDINLPIRDPDKMNFFALVTHSEQFVKYFSQNIDKLDKNSKFHAKALNREIHKRMGNLDPIDARNANKDAERIQRLRKGLRYLANLL